MAFVPQAGPSVPAGMEAARHAPLPAGSNAPAPSSIGEEADVPHEPEPRPRPATKFRNDPMAWVIYGNGILVIALLTYFLAFDGSREVATEGATQTRVGQSEPACDKSRDGDGDGVNDCNDKCPGSQDGQTIGADGCPVPVSIDLKGVNFDFDKSTLRPDAVEILNQTIDILKRYPDLKVEVAGHTDSVGSDAYNQKLSERRAKAVYDYLTSNGVHAARLVGPNGYGESRPIAPNTDSDGLDNPYGRAQNNRVDLNIIPM
jgi:outer membrane protein OmpA-like peptidoglycan-associated protein